MSDDFSDPTQLLAKAEKKAQTSTSGFIKLFTGSSEQSKFEECSDLCHQAGNIFRIRKQLFDAGKAYNQSAVYQIKAKNEDDASNLFIESFKCFKSSNNESKDSKVMAVSSLNSAIDIFVKRGQFRRAANFKFELGEILELDLQNFDDAIEAYQSAADWYEQDQAFALSNKCLVKLANLKSLNGKFLDAANVYQKLINNSLNNRLSQWIIKEYYLKMGLCQLAAEDTVAAKRTLHEGQANDSNFATSKEAELLDNLIQSCEEGDSESFEAAVVEFDKFSKLDKWYTSILLKVKETITEAEDDLL